MNSSAPQDTQEFDLQPDPRILPMLGEINLVQWRCLAELIDNSVDGFLSAKRNSNIIESPRISVALPTRDVSTAKVTVADNGPGMSPSQLENAVSAGWSGNTPIDSLGMFGMGFNIATARLGTVTTVWTTRQDDNEWHGLQIDFEELQKQGHFRTPHIKRPKIDPSDHGTEISIESLKPNQRQWLSKTTNRSRINKELSRTYSAMLRNNGIPITFALHVNANRITEKNHCVWDESRSVETPRHGIISAFQTIDNRLDDRPFCLNCWQWLPSGNTVCPSCANRGNVVTRERRVRGWVGIQRYLSKSDYGIDFIRNGRKIELASKELFSWNDGDLEEPEYPIDDPRSRGRIVGEIHLDHCRVTYTKDRFDRNDPAWEEMVRIVRGDGPLLPNKAKDLGYGENNSPLFRLFQAFRRSSPKPKTAGCWARILVVQNNEHASEMAKRFYSGESEYQDDTKWWELVEEQDRQLLGDSHEAQLSNNSDGPLPGFGDTTNIGNSDSQSGTSIISPANVTSPIRSALHLLSQEFRHERTEQKWNIEAFSVESSDPELCDTKCPWKLTANTSGTHNFYVDLSHEIFRSATMTSLDGLLTELAWSASDFLRNQENSMPFSVILADLRERYARVSALDPILLEADAKSILSAIARTLPRNIDPADGKTLFEEMSSNDREQTISRMSNRSILNVQEWISSGGFFQHAPHRALLSCFSRHADLFLDGKCWDRQYEELDLLNERVTERAKLEVVAYFEGLLRDAIWLAEQESTDLIDCERARLLRASLALELLIPTNTGEDDSGSE